MKKKSSSGCNPHDEIVGEAVAEEALQEPEGEASPDSYAVVNQVNVSSYLAEGFLRDVERFQSSCGIKTGYKNIDAQQMLYPGFYAIGAISSLGKTTFVHQMCDQISEAGHPVLFFALEQSASELVSKSLARRMYQRSQDDKAYETYTSLQIRCGEANGSEELEEQLGALAKITENQCIVECCGARTEDITGCIQDFHAASKAKGKTPVVVIDYLQIIQPDSGRSNMDGRRHIDAVIEKLRELQMELNLVLICICSVNRANYLAPIGFESFKETGAIEYTADVVWGLQFSVINKAVFSQNGSIVEKRTIMDDAKGANPREIELVVLKNRFGKTSTTFYFDYYPEHDTFVARGSRNAGGKAQTVLSAEEYYRGLRAALSGNAQRAV